MLGNNGVACVIFFVALLLGRSDCRPQLPLPVGQTLGHATDTLNGAAGALPLGGAVAQGVLTPVRTIPQSLPVVGGVLNG
ncbi:unnamed protein product [Ceratitis capitata]|uniref:(Mediterranean fruit fly) hypothetical protein n=1 Tax=Ceratitis capitata TaxID=7213 RepID=A0A811U430_CERCA|nr:unnamed protein product [Ceratitis capitata]